MAECCYAECHYAECRVAWLISFAECHLDVCYEMLSVILPSDMLLNVMAPKN
jgi:hypothetical protein